MDGDVDGGLSPGELVAGYVVGERLGVGGFGEVYAAKHSVIGKEVAIKILHRRYSHDADAVARFVAEARAVDRIHHVGIVDIFDFGQLPDGRQFCVMEKIRGQTLRHLLAERGRLPLVEALPILRAIAEAIDAAHGAGVAHRDLKPDNIFVIDAAAEMSVSGSGAPIVKLIDFGLAKLTDGDAAEAASVTRTGAMAGTPLYMSPEQCRGRNVDARTDLYSFGALAYHVVTGAPPFSGDALELALHHINDAPESPSSRCNDLPTSVDRSLLALLDKDPALRPAPLAAAIDAITSGRRARRRPVRWIVAMFGGAILVGGVALRSCAADHTSSPDAAQHTVPHFIERHLAVKVERNLLWPALSPDGKTLIYNDRGWSAFHIDTASTETINTPAECRFGYLSPLVGGRFLAGCPDATGPWVWLQGADGTRVRIVAGAWPEASPDGKRLAFLRGEMIVVRDIDGDTETEIASAAKVEGRIRWSPDNTHLVWARRSDDGLARLEIASTTPPSVESIPVALLDPASLITGRQTAGSSGPAAFRDPNHLIYCASDATGRRVEERTLEGSDANRTVTLRALDADVVGCSVTASVDGRVVIVAYRNTGGGSLLALDDPRAEWRLVRDPVDVPVELTADGRVLLAKPRSDDREPIQLRSVALDGHGAEPVATCEGATDIIRWGSVLRQLDVRTEGPDRVLRLRSQGDCKTVEEWRVPARPGWGRLRCGAAFCVVARREGRRTDVWQLRAGAVRGTQLTAADVTSNLYGLGAVDLAISPDGNFVVMVGGDYSVRVISVNGKPTALGAPVRELDLGSWQFQHIVWSNDAKHFYASACCPPGDTDAERKGQAVRIVRSDLEGHSEIISDPDRSFTYTRIAITALSLDGKTLAGYTTRIEPDVMLLELEPSSPTSTR